jgi:acyl-coenzyme A synthetase/AMP-(fatty) acid ligase
MAPYTLAEALEGWGDNPALIPVGRARPITRSALKKAVYDLAKTLQQSGIRKGDVVSIAEANTVSKMAKCMLLMHSLSSRLLLAAMQTDLCNSKKEQAF